MKKLYAWGCEIVEENSLKETRSRLQKMIETEVKLLNNDYSKIFIGGLSQGSITSLDFGLTYKEQLGGIVGISGHLADLTQIMTEKKNLNIFIFNGENDQTMKFQYVKDSYKRLIDASFSNMEIYFDKVDASFGFEHFGSMYDPKVISKVFSFFQKLQDKNLK